MMNVLILSFVNWEKRTSAYRNKQMSLVADKVIAHNRIRRAQRLYELNPFDFASRLVLRIRPCEKENGDGMMSSTRAILITLSNSFSG